MSDYKVTDSELTGIANAIRTKGGTSSPLVFPNGFTSAIGAIPTGGGVVQPLSVAQNGTYTPPSGVDGYAPVTVNVSGGGGAFNVTRKNIISQSDQNVNLEVEFSSAISPIIPSQDIGSDLIYETETQQKNGLYLFNLSYRKYIAYDLGDHNTSFTAYAIVNSNVSGSSLPLLGACASLSDKKAPAFIVNRSKIYASMYNATFDSGLNAIDAWRLLTIRINANSMEAEYYVDGVKLNTVMNILESGRYIALNSYYPDLTQKICDANYAYFAVSEAAESDETILANHALLMNYYSDLFN